MKSLKILAFSLALAAPAVAQTVSSANPSSGRSSGSGGGAAVSSRSGSGGRSGTTTSGSAATLDTGVSGTSTNETTTGANGITTNPLTDTTNPGDASARPQSERLQDDANTAPRVAPAGGLPSGAAATTDGTATGALGTQGATNDRGAVPNGTAGSRAGH